MGHSYIAVVAFGVKVDVEQLCIHLKVENTREFNKFEEVCIHYERQCNYDPLVPQHYYAKYAFVVAKTDYRSRPINHREMSGDVRGGFNTSGPERIDVESLELTDDEKETLKKFLGDLYEEPELCLFGYEGS
jgi:hypothetical protein